MEKDIFIFKRENPIYIRYIMSSRKPTQKSAKKDPL